MAPTDRLEIEALLRRFGQLNDEGRFEELALLFTDDGRFSRPSDAGHLTIGRRAILEAFRARPPGPQRHHLVGDVEVMRLDGDDASVRSRSIVLVDLGERGGQVSIGGFRDELRRHEGVWRFASRTGFTLAGPLAHAERGTLDWPPVASG